MTQGPVLEGQDARSGTGCVSRKHGSIVTLTAAQGAAARLGCPHDALSARCAAGRGTEPGLLFHLIVTVASRDRYRYPCFYQNNENNNRCLYKEQ